MTLKRFRYLVLICFTAWFASCDQIIQNTPSTISGEWKVEETHYITGKTNYYISIEYTDTLKTGIKIYNFNNLNSYHCTAKLSGNYITIPSQKLGNNTVKGSGTVSSDNKTITFNYNDDPYGDGGGSVTAKCTRLE